jgi:hypothetical protein
MMEKLPSDATSEPQAAPKAAVAPRGGPASHPGPAVEPAAASVGMSHQFTLQYLIAAIKKSSK